MACIIAGSFEVLQQETDELGASSVAYFHAEDASCDSIIFSNDCESRGHHYLVRAINGHIEKCEQSSTAKPVKMRMPHT